MRCCAGGWLVRTNVCLLFWSEKSERAGLQTWPVCCMERLSWENSTFIPRVRMSETIDLCTGRLFCLSQTCGYMSGYIKMIFKRFSG